MTVWTALFIGYAAITVGAIEKLRINKRLKNVEIRLGDFESS